MANESQVLKVVAGGAGKIPTAEVSLVDASGAPIDLSGAAVAAELPALPTADGLYALSVASGVYAWVEAEPAA